MLFRSNIGQASGAAAALCVKQGLAPAALPVRQLQQTLIDDLQAPAGMVPLWDTPWHHPHWRERQAMALDDPNGLSPAGTLVACPSHLSPYEGAPQPGERAYSGTVIPDGSGGYSLEMESGRWPLITLEPGLDQWLNTLDRPTQIGRAHV